MDRRRIFTDEHIKFIKENVKGRPNKELTEMLNKEFGTNFKKSQVQRFKHGNKISSGLTGRFPKGHVAHNKGMKQEEYMSKEAIEKSKATRFKKGQKSTSKRPVGSTRLDKGVLYRKIKEPDVWEYEHRVVWRRYFGKIPRGNVIVFLDNNVQNTNIENLACVPRGVLARMNKYDKWSDFPEVNKAKTLLHEVDLKKNKRLKNEEEKQWTT